MMKKCMFLLYFPHYRDLPFSFASRKPVGGGAGGGDYSGVLRHGSKTE